MSSAAVYNQHLMGTHDEYLQQSETDSSAVNFSPNQAGNSTSSPPSGRRAAGRQSSSGNPSSPDARQQHYETPTRSDIPHNQPAEGMSNSTYNQYYPDQANLPIRTSQQQAPPSAAAGGYSSPSYDSRGQQSSGTYGSEVSDSERRRQQQQQRSPQRADPSPQQQSNAGRGQRARNAPAPSRSQNAMGQTPLDTSLPREASAVINRIVVDDPATDIARERTRIADAKPQSTGTASTALPVANMSDPMSDGPSSAPPGQRSRQEHLRQSSHRKETKFGEYILGQTLGEGEFGKVKMGWKKDSIVQVAIKLIRKDSLAGNTTRLPKIMREIEILRGLQHPNIVKLHEFIETTNHMGIVLEYASGGELFDYILNHRFLKDPAARRLFAQLVSGVGYLHKKGIVHRDLKLENLLLDRNKNIIITDFGFANTFNARDELGEDVESRITDKQFVKDSGLDLVGHEGMRRGDLMQTSCGSPCYAAPELVVSDGVYTGRKVDVWSVGVILYAMLAGYLPFDDDPANPEGDNINLLYKYITTTPLTFPEYVTPHARDLLRRILVPDPRKRADLFEVARHSWLSEYSHVVGFIGCVNKSDMDIANSAMQSDGEAILGRSASVREPTRSQATAPNSAQKMTAAGLGDEQARADARKDQRDAKRRTVQVEYVAPSAGPARTKARGDSQGPVEVTAGPQVPRKEVPVVMLPPSRQARATSDSIPAFTGQSAGSASRSTTGSGLVGNRMPSRGNSYSQPVAAIPTTANAVGLVSQPKSSTGYIISSPLPIDHPDAVASSRPQSQHNLAQFQQQHNAHLQQQQEARDAEQERFRQKGHKRSSTLGSIGDRLLGRSNSRRNSQQKESMQGDGQGIVGEADKAKRDRKYPPVSMKNALPNRNEEAAPRTSTESKRRPSFTFLRKNSDAPSQSGNDSRRNSRRFSFLPNNFSMASFTGGAKKEQNQGYESGESNLDVGASGLNGAPSGASNGMLPGRQDSTRRPQSKGLGPMGVGGMAFGRGQSRTPSAETTNSTIPLYYEADREAARDARRSGQMPQSAYGQPQMQQQGGRGTSGPARLEKALPPQPPNAGVPVVPRKQFRDDGFGGNALDSQPQHGVQQRNEDVERFYTPQENAERAERRYQSEGAGPVRQSEQDFMDDGYNATQPIGGSNLRAGGRKFEGGAYEQGHSGSSSSARKVMNFFRMRGKDRGSVA